MAHMPPLLSLTDISLTFGGKPVFENLSMRLCRGEKVCLVGRNGTGKSTLLKVLAGIVEIDRGQFYEEPGTRVAYLAQDVAMPQSSTILEYLQNTTGCEAYQAEAILDVLKTDPHWPMTNLSGGERRRVALAQTLVQEPDVLLMDEPTNHLDLPAIEWLETVLNQFRGAVMTISHDRRFLEKVSTSTLWLDRGILRQSAQGFADFERWSEEVFAEEERQAERLDSKLKLENVWLQRGVTARRKRNQGRLRKLHDMRAQRREMNANKIGKMAMAAAGGDIGSRMVIEANHISKAYHDKKLVDDFSIRILRGDRIGIIGPNGGGKTTLLKMLVGQLTPDTGHVQVGANIQLIYFDQLRDSLNPKDTLWDTLCDMGGDQVMVQGQPRHVVAYLKDFLFAENQVRSPVSVLSGGEKNRLALAKALTQPGNLLVLDEPTNDLDMDTLDLLQEMLSDFEGTLLIVSHDRDFLDKLTLSLIAVEGHGVVHEYVGGYADYLRQRPPVLSSRQSVATSARTSASQVSPTSANTDKKTSTTPRLGFKEKRDYEMLPAKIEALSAEISQAELKLAHPDFYQKHPQEFLTLTQWLAKARETLEADEYRWLELAEKMEL